MKTAIAPTVYIIIGIVELNGHTLRIRSTRPAPDNQEAFANNLSSLQISVVCDCGHEARYFVAPKDAKEMVQTLIKQHIPSWEPEVKVKQNIDSGFYSNLGGLWGGQSSTFSSQSGTFQEDLISSLHGYYG